MRFVVLAGELSQCFWEKWSPTIGDPTLMGWFTVFAYAVAAILALVVLLRRSSYQRTFWIVLMIALVFLTVNKQLDLQSAFTTYARCLSKLQGWYDQRRSLQAGFIITVGVVSLIFALGFTWSLRRGLSRIWLALFGFIFLLAFVFMRAAGFHGFDGFIGLEFGAFRLNWILELAGIFMIATNAIYLISRGPEEAPVRRRRRRRRRRSSRSDLPYRREHPRSRST